MRLLVTGADGLLGSAVARGASERGHDVVEGVRGLEDGKTAAGVGNTARPTSRVLLDVTDRHRVIEVVSDTAPDAIVHCAGYTDVDGAETHSEEAFAVNVSGARWVARAAAEIGSVMLLPSTDYVFDGTASRPYRPGDPPDPINLYGRSKWMGEEEVRMSGATWLVVRTSWLYGSGGPNFVDGILAVARGRALRSGADGESPDATLGIVDDQRGRPTWTGSLAPTLIDLLEQEMEDQTVTHPAGTPEPDRVALVGASASGRTLHLADRGEATWYELADEALDLAGVDAELVPVSSDEWGAAAARPGYSVLDLEEAEGVLGRRMPHWRESLRRYLCSSNEESP